MGRMDGARCRTRATQFGVGKPTLIAQIISILLPSSVQEMGLCFFSLFLLFPVKDACLANPFEPSLPQGDLLPLQFYC